MSVCSIYWCTQSASWLLFCSVKFAREQKNKTSFLYSISKPCNQFDAKPLWHKVKCTLFKRWGRIKPYLNTDAQFLFRENGHSRRDLLVWNSTLQAIERSVKYSAIFCYGYDCAYSYIYLCTWAGTCSQISSPCRDFAFRRRDAVTFFYKRTTGYQKVFLFILFLLQFCMCYIGNT